MPSKSKPDIRGLDPAALLIPRSMTASILGGKSIAFVKKLERQGLLDAGAADAKSKTDKEAQVFHPRAQVLALAGVSEDADEKGPAL